MRAAILAAALAWLAPSGAEAQELARAVRERCIQSVIRVEVETPAGVLSGSGTMIDPRGYVLTNFHVVGHVDERHGLPGTYHAPRFRIAVTTTEREPVVDRYVAEVVRAHVTLDLAILRIVERDDGTPITTPFVAMPIATSLPELGTRVWALGFPAGVRTVNITSGQIAGFDANVSEQTAWLRTDTEFNPGNSGGSLIDRDCRLVGIPTAVSDNVEPIELARPAMRIPAPWISALTAPGAAALERTPVEGITRLTALTEILDAQLGDAAGPTGERRYYALPRDRPGIVTVSPRLEMRVIGPGGRLLRGGSGQALVTASDPQSALVAVMVPRSRAGVAPRVHLRFTPMAPPAPGPAEGIAIRGRVALEGASCALHAIVAAPEIDLAALARDLSNGAIAEAELRARVRAIVRLGEDGSFVIRAPSGAGALTFGVLGPRGIEPRTIEVGTSEIDLGAIALPAGCR